MRKKKKMMKARKIGRKIQPQLKLMKWI